MSAAAPPGYRALRALARLLLAVFYRRLEVVGLERVPPAAPLVVAANHTNALIDPMLLLAALPRRLTPVAKAPLFRHPVLAPFLALAGAIPVERRQDEGSDPAKNEAALAALAAALARGAAVLVFPEGVSQPEPRLMPLRTGAARMLLAAEAGTRVGVTLLPVGLVFDAPGTFRGGRALVLIGSPVPTDDCVAERARDPRAAARRLTDRLAAALRRQTVEAEDRETLRLIQLTERVWRHTAGGDGTGVAGPGAAASAEWLRRAARAYRYLRAHAPADVARFRRDVERHAADLDRWALGPAQVARGYAAGAATRYALGETLALAAAAPLALLGLVLHALPYRATALAARLARPEADTEATLKLAGATLLYPLAWAAEVWLVWTLAGGVAAALVVAALLPAGFFAIAWRERLARLAREARGLLTALARRDLRARLAARQRALAADVERFAARVPESVLSGDAG